jgi:hypothetical protein
MKYPHIQIPSMTWLIVAPIVGMLLFIGAIIYLPKPVEPAIPIAKNVGECYESDSYGMSKIIKVETIEDHTYTTVMRFYIEKGDPVEDTFFTATRYPAVDCKKFDKMLQESKINWLWENRRAK